MQVFDSFGDGGPCLLTCLCRSYCSAVSRGVTHGFLLVRSLAGEILGQGEVTQIAQEGGLVESRLVFRFNDGSVHDEKVAFSQNGVFTLLTYHLIQRGPLFPEQVDIFFDPGAGEY